jgi:hypothetical protein
MDALAADPSGAVNDSLEVHDDCARRGSCRVRLNLVFTRSTSTNGLPLSANRGKKPPSLCHAPTESQYKLKPVAGLRVQFVLGSFVTRWTPLLRIPLVQ